MNIIDSIPDININDFLKSLSYFEDMLNIITLFPYFYSLILRDVIVPNRDINEKNYRLPNGIVKLAKNTPPSTMNTSPLRILPASVAPSWWSVRGHSSSNLKRVRICHSLNVITS